MTRDHLLNAIYADLDDDEARLVYADYLTDRGDPRGEFIALQIAFEGIGTGPPFYDRLRDPRFIRADELLDEHRAKWQVRFGVEVNRYSFRRGFIDTLEMPCESWLNGGTRLRNEIPTVEGLRLRCQARRPEIVHRLLQRLHELQPYRALAFVGERHVVGHFRGPADTDLRADFGDDIARALEINQHDLERLTHLGIIDCELSPRGMDRLASAKILSTRLQRLDLSRNHWGPAGFDALASIEFEKLERIDLSETYLDEPSVVALANSSLLETAQVIDLSATYHPIMPGICMWPRAPRLRSLLLSLTPIGDQGVAAFLDAPASQRLEVFSAHNCEIGPAGASRLAERDLSLDLSGNPIGNDGLRALAASARLPQIPLLSACGITDDGLEGLRGSIPLAKSSTLALDANPITDRGVAVLATLPELSHVQALTLNNVHMSDEGARRLAASPYLHELRSLSLHATNVTARGIRALLDSKTFPRTCRIEPPLTVDSELAAVARSRHG